MKRLFILLITLLALSLMVSCSQGSPFEGKLEYGACHSYIEYASCHPDWEYLTAVRGEFTGIANSGDAQDSMIIIEGEFSSAECEPIVYYRDGQWWIGIATEQYVKAKVEVEAGKSYQYLVEIVDKGIIHYTIRPGGELLLEWTGEHGGRHDYFNDFNTSLEVYPDDGCSSSHQAYHTMLWAWDSKANVWLDANVAYALNRVSGDKLCDMVTPPLNLYIEHESNILSDYCLASYGSLWESGKVGKWDAWSYDRNNDGKVSFKEVMLVLQDYFKRKITKGQAIQVVQIYFGN